MLRPQRTFTQGISVSTHPDGSVPLFFYSCHSSGSTSTCVNSTYGSSVCPKKLNIKKYNSRFLVKRKRKRQIENSGENLQPFLDFWLVPGMPLS